MQNTLIVILGPTGVGKTDIAISIASRFRSEIISCDSRQFFREMKTGTAVPSDDQQRLVPHHFIRFLSVNDYYNSSMFERDVLEKLPGIFSRNSICILTGGSGMYIDAVCDGIDDIPDTDPAIRDKYIRKYREDGIEGLRSALKLLDPEHYKKVDLRNHKRIIRALEICETTGIPYSSFMRGIKREREFRIIKIGLEMPREELYARVTERVDRMVADGLVEEARGLYDRRHLNALNTVGYKELFDHFDGKVSLEEALSNIKKNTRRYAKRQITWWARDKRINWFNPEGEADIIDFILKEVQ